MTTHALDAYRGYIVPPDLADRVEAIWTLDTQQAQPWREYLWPSLAVDLIFAGSRYGRGRAGDVHQLSSSVLEPASMRGRSYEHGAVNRLTGVRLLPGCVALSGVPSVELGQRVVELDAWDALARSWIWEEADPSRRVAVVVAWLRETLPAAGVGPALVQGLERNTSLHGLAQEFEVSSRTLRRWARATVGLSLQEIRRLLRFRRTARQLDRRFARESFSVLYEEYSDQPHFCRECRALTGRSPSFWWPASEQIYRG